MKNFIFLLKIYALVIGFVFISAALQAQHNGEHKESFSQENLIFQIDNDNTGGTNGSFQFRAGSSNGTTLMTLLRNGNLRLTNSFSMASVGDFQVDGPNNPGGRFRINTAGNINVGGSGMFQVDAPNILGGRFTILPNGNVGIGTPSPQAHLEIKSSNPVSTFLKLTNASINGQSWALRSESGSSPFGQGSFVIVDASNEAIDLPRFSINKDGMVGIGTTTPTARLDIAGQIKISGGSPGAGKVLTSDANGLASWQNASSQWTTSGAHISYNAGNVGIGTATPSNKLHVQDGNGSIELAANDGGIEITSGNDDRSYIDFKGNANTSSDFVGRILHTDGLGFSFSSNVGVGGTITATRFVGDGSGLTGIIGGSSQWATSGNNISYGDGNVGIGTTTPDKGKLHVRGSMHVEGTNGTQVFHVSSGKQLVFVGDSAWIQYQASHDTSPIQQNRFSLWVSKGIVSEDYAIASVNDWDDYVFNQDYQLPALEKVADFIKTNKHLPNIPSEAEVKQNGYNLHQMNRNFLKTIEELTLYAIAQDQKIKSLEGKIQQYEQLAEEVEKLKGLMAELKK